MHALPIFFNITNRLCIVIGGGGVAARKVNVLLKANAAVTVIAPHICYELQTLVETNAIKFIRASYAASQLEGACLWFPPRTTMP